MDVKWIKREITIKLGEQANKTISKEFGSYVLITEETKSCRWERMGVIELDRWFITYVEPCSTIFWTFVISEPVWLSSIKIVKLIKKLI